MRASLVKSLSLHMPRPAILTTYGNSHIHCAVLDAWTSVVCRPIADPPPPITHDAAQFMCMDGHTLGAATLVLYLPSGAPPCLALARSPGPHATPPTHKPAAQTSATPSVRPCAALEDRRGCGEQSAQIQALGERHPGTKSSRGDVGDQPRPHLANCRQAI